jgi:D-ribose pyranase
VKRAGILNQPLSRVLAGLGHGDLLMVVDAGYPIPRGADRVDLALARDLPDLRTVLALLHDELIVEGVVIADEVSTGNAPLDGWLRATFAGAGFRTRPHAEMLSAVAAEAKAFVRTGAFDPWGNVGLVSGVDVRAWFAKPGVVAPDYYRDRLVTPA